MARTLYAGRPGDTVAALFNIGERLVYALPADANGDPTSVTLTVWDEPDGTQLTDLLAADGTTPISAVMVPPGTVQIPAFYGPDGVTDELWLRDPEGDYTRLDIGPEGAAGATGGVWFSGSGAPSGSTGAVGDWYINTANSDVYRKTAVSTWTLQMNIKGATGSGDVTGPASATNNRIVVFDGATGKVVKDSGKSLSEFQPIDLDLSAIAALVSAADKMLYATGPGAWSLADLTVFARTLLDDATAATARATLEAAGSVGGAREKILESTGSGAKPLDCAAYSGMVLTSLSGPVTISLTNLPSAAGWMFTYTVTIVQSGTVRAITWPTVSWVGGAAPTDTASKTTIVTLWKYGTSSTIYGSHGTFG